MLSIIVPVFEEEKTLVELQRQIASVCRENDIDYELIFVDDGSRDQSWEIIRELSQEHREVTGIRFRRNFGKAAALTAGMKAAEGEIIMMMDADLQDDPAEIPKFLEKYRQGYDVVNGWKEHRHDPWHKVYPSKIFNWMIGRLSGLKLHDHNCGIKLFHRDVASEIRIYGELHRFIAVLAYSRGFKIAEVPVHHRSRKFGHSKYGMKRFARGFLDLLTVTFLTGYGQRPHHILGGIGLFFFALGAIGFTYLSVLWCLMNISHLIPATPIGSRPLLTYSTAATILGAQAMSIGLLAEMIVAYNGRDRDTYSVSDRTDWPTGTKTVSRPE